jgi:hypothetical protein
MVLDRSNSGIVGSNPTRRMDEISHFCVVLSRIRRGLAMGLSPVQRVLPKCRRGFTVSDVHSDLEQTTEFSIPVLTVPSANKATESIATHQSTHKATNK